MRRADKNRLKGHFYFLYIIKTANEQERFTNIGSRCRRRGKAKSLPKKNEEQSTERTTEINYMWTCVWSHVNLQGAVAAEHLETETTAMFEHRRRVLTSHRISCRVWLPYHRHVRRLTYTEHTSTFIHHIGRINEPTSCTGGGRHNVPRPTQVDLWPFDLENGAWVTCDVGYLCANFSLPIHSKLLLFGSNKNLLVFNKKLIRILA